MKLIVVRRKNGYLFHYLDQLIVLIWEKTSLVAMTNNANLESVLVMDFVNN
jgi:hypothetical protein